MTLAQIATWINQAIRFKLHPDQIVLIMDAAQHMAFDYNSQSFLVWSETLTPLAATLTYDAPTDPPCRKIWGVTTETDGRIFGTSEDADLFPMDDFDFEGRLFNPNRFFKPGREDNISKTFTFAQQPDITGAGVYRWVYWRDSPTIGGVDPSDDADLLIPATYHMSFVNACIKLAQINLFGEDVDPKIIQAFFQPWWNTLARPYTPMGKKTNQTLNPRGSSDSLI